MAWNEPGKGRDPWGGGNGRDSGGPDMDQMVRNIQRKLGGMFGGGGGGGRGEAGGVFGIVVLALVAFLAYDMIHIVQPGERGVVLRFGAHVATLEAGPAIRLPRPIERVIKVNVEEVSQYSHKALMLTQDENIVDVELAVQYRRVNAADYLFNLVGPDVTLGQAAESAVREIAGKTTMDFILGAGRAEVAQATQQLMQEIVDQYESGITILSVNLVDAQPPEPVQAAFADAIKAREDQERIINEAHAYANDVVPRARGASARVLEEANAYREGMIARATGESDRFLQVLTEYERAPEVTRERLYIEAVEEVLAGSHKVLIDLEGSGNLMVLPLDQIMRQVSGAATPMADPDGQRDARARAAAAETREREAARSRRAP